MPFLKSIILKNKDETMANYLVENNISCPERNFTVFSVSKIILIVKKILNAIFLHLSSRVAHNFIQKCLLAEIV